MIQAIPSKL